MINEKNAAGNEVLAKIIIFTLLIKLIEDLKNNIKINSRKNL